MIECALGAARRQETQCDGDAHAQPFQARMDRERVVGGLDWILEEHVHQPLVPEEFHLLREPWAGEMGARLRERRERFVRWQRHPRVHHAWIRELHFAFVQVDVVSEPQVGCRAQRRIRAREVQIAGAALGHGHFAHRGERHAQQQLQRTALRLDESLHPHVGRNFVRCARQRDQQHGGKRDHRTTGIGEKSIYDAQVRHELEGRVMGYTGD